MLNMVKGCVVYDPSLLSPGYERTPTGFMANVDAEKILPLIEEFLSRQDSHIFFFLEIPTNEKDEPNPEHSVHRDVYYWDGLTAEFARELLRIFGELLIHDGMNWFGFGVHGFDHEIMKQPYNVVTIYTHAPERYDGMFEALNIPQTDDLKTAWSFFTVQTPGTCLLHECSGKNIYDLVEMLKPYGLYFGERKEIS